MRTDDWYDFQTNPRVTATVLVTIDESSYMGGMTGADHPRSDTRRRAAAADLHRDGAHGRSYADPLFRGHLAGAIRWAAASDCRGCRCEAAGSRGPAAGHRLDVLDLHVAALHLDDQRLPTRTTSPCFDRVSYFRTPCCPRAQWTSRSRSLAIDLTIAQPASPSPSGPVTLPISVILTEVRAALRCIPVRATTMPIFTFLPVALVRLKPGSAEQQRLEPRKLTGSGAPSGGVLTREHLHRLGNLRVRHQGVCPPACAPKAPDLTAGSAPAADRRRTHR